MALEVTAITNVTATIEKPESGAIGEFRILCYSSIYMPVSMALLPLGVYVLPYYAELGISLYVMSAIIFTARL